MALAPRFVRSIICLFCGKDISQFKQQPITVANLEFLLWIGKQDGDPGKDTITAAECCQECYANILANRAAGIKEFGKIKEE